MNLAIDKKLCGKPCCGTVVDSYLGSRDGFGSRLSLFDRPGLGNGRQWRNWRDGNTTLLDIDIRHVFDHLGQFVALNDSVSAGFAGLEIRCL